MSSLGYACPIRSDPLLTCSEVLAYIAMDYNEDAINHNRPSASEAQKRSGNVVVTMESFQRSQAEWLAAQQLALLQPVEAIPLPPLRPLPMSEFVWPVMSIEEFSARVDALRMNRSVEKRQERVTEPAGGFQSKKPSTLSVEHQRQMDEEMDALQRDIDRMLAEKAPKPLEPLPPLPGRPSKGLREIAYLTQLLDEDYRRRTAEPAEPFEGFQEAVGLSAERQRQLDEFVETRRQEFDDNLARIRPEPMGPLRRCQLGRKSG